MRIVFIRGPVTPAGYLPRLFVYIFFSFFGTGLLFLIVQALGRSNIIGPDLLSSSVNAIHLFLEPITGPVINWSGLLLDDPLQRGLIALFILLFLRPVYVMLQMTGMKLQQLATLENAYGPLSRPQHRLWLVFAFVALGAAALLRYLPQLSLADFALIELMQNCARVAVYIGLLVGGLCCLAVGYNLRRSWLKGRPAQPVKAQPRHLRVAVDNTGLPADTAKPALKTAPRDEVDGLYVALTAELVQACGRLKALPTTEQLVEPLLLMQKAASMTRSGSFYHPDIHTACARAITLLQEGKLKTLPTLAAALRLFKAPAPPQLRAIARELQEKIGEVPSLH